MDILTITLKDLFPNIEQSLENSGFLFGAGTSKQAGFPLTSELTQKVYSKLNNEEKELLASLFNRKEIDFSIENGIPDIETGLNIISEFRLLDNFNISEIQNLETHLQNFIVEEIRNVNDPNLDLHIQFFKSLKKLIDNKYQPIWLFTPNYDLVFEYAASEAQIPIRNGFEGIFKRYFMIDKMDLVNGRVKSGGFNYYKTPVIKLLKLHGSISWYKEDSKIFEDNSNTYNNPAIIHPRKTKVMDTLESPFDRLFEYSSRVIGGECKYLVTCGYSFRDEHINNRLLLPKLREKKIRIVALFNSEPDNIDSFKEYRAFSYITRENSFIDGERRDGSDIGIFSILVDMIRQKSGLRVD